MLITLEEARSSSLRNIAGACNLSSEFLQLLNDATRQLMRRGDWAGTVQPIYACTKRGCVVMPRYVGQIRKINWCNSKLPIHNMWWKFMLYESYKSCCDTSSQCNMLGQGHTAVQQDVVGSTRLIRAYHEAYADIGKTVTIFGLDDNLQPLKTQNTNGTWSPGIILTLAAPFASSSTYVSRIDRVLKDETTGPVRLYAYDATNDVLEDIAVYEPSETNPDYVRYHLNVPKCDDTDCGASKPITALVKLKYIPAKLDTDLVLIQNLDALKDMMQAIKFKEANDIKSAREYEASAIRELNLELADENPIDQVTVSVEPFNGINWTNNCY